MFLFLFLLTVYVDGRVCISILHAPGDDPMGYETSAERWSPVQSVEKILLSVVSMLAGESPLPSIASLFFFHHNLISSAKNPNDFVWFFVFNGISIFMGYLMPKPPL